MKNTIQSKSTQKSSKAKRSRSKKPASPKPGKHPLLQETFSKQLEEQQVSHLIQEHELQLLVQEDVHQARLRSIQSQLQVQLFQMWNDAWLQRKKSFDQGFKEWLKVFAS